MTFYIMEDIDYEKYIEETEEHVNSLVDADGMYRGYDKDYWLGITLSNIIRDYNEYDIIDIRATTTKEDIEKIRKIIKQFKNPVFVIENTTEKISKRGFLTTYMSYNFRR